MNKYITDTDVLIGFYDSLPMDIYKTQWNKIGDYIQNGQLLICEAVFNEIKKAEDFKLWLTNYKGFLLKCYTEEVLVEAKVIINKYRKLIDINNQSDQSDPYIIALAKINDYTVLSNERYSEGGNKTKIPFVCKEMGIKCINTHDFYKQETWQF